MTPGIRRLLLRVFKFVLVPIILLLAGYLIVGPLVSDWMNREGLERSEDFEESPEAPDL